MRQAAEANGQKRSFFGRALYIISITPFLMLIGGRWQVSGRFEHVYYSNYSFGIQFLQQRNNNYYP